MPRPTNSKIAPRRECRDSVFPKAAGGPVFLFCLGNMGE